MTNNKGDLISREALKAEVALMFGDKTHITECICDLIDNAPTVSDRYDEGYAQGYIDGSTGADWRGDAE